MVKQISEVKTLFIADTHLGFDYPIKPKIVRRRRGDDFFNNYHIALQQAFDKKVDFVLHGGDMFFRAKGHQSVVTKSFEPLLKIAESGIPVIIVPGNHERSFLPVSLLETHPNIFIFDKPRSFNFTIRNIKVSFAGFPCIRKNIKDKFVQAANETGFVSSNADFKFLCMHQTVEGAVVGVQNFTFKYGDDIIRGADIPEGLDAVLSGHIHRMQVLERDLTGKRLRCPVIYPGSIERTSSAEREERKGYYILTLSKDSLLNYKKLSWDFKTLYARPMINKVINLDYLQTNQIQDYVRGMLSKLDKDGVVRIKIEGTPVQEKLKMLNANFLRNAAPVTMNVDLALPYDGRFNRN